MNEYYTKKAIKLIIILLITLLSSSTNVNADTKKGTSNVSVSVVSGEPKPSVPTPQPKPSVPSPPMKLSGGYKTILPQTGEKAIILGSVLAGGLVLMTTIILFFQNRRKNYG